MGPEGPRQACATMVFMAGNLIQFRVDTDLSADIEEFIETVAAEGQKITKSAACRQLLRAALGTPSMTAAARESMMTTLGIQKRVFARVNEILQDELPLLIAEESI